LERLKYKAALQNKGRKIFRPGAQMALGRAAVETPLERAEFQTGMGFTMRRPAAGLHAVVTCASGVMRAGEVQNE
jgi:hypothetical protein